MSIDLLNPNNKEERSTTKEPLLNISLPAPQDGNPKSPLSIGQHNASAMKNFEQISRIFLTLINNQKTMSSLMVEMQKELKSMKEENGKLATLIRELLKENDTNEQRPSDK